jgi:polar amino acid transport system substrate-binding protein
VNELKIFVRGGSGKHFERIDINRVVRTVVDLSHHFIRKATNHFRLELTEELPRVKGDRIRLEQVVLNLLQNACQALTDKDSSLCISTSFDGTLRTVCIEVADEGVGIPQADLSQLTDPFFTTRRDSGGTGLGLSVSARIVRDHGGTLSFDSRLGEGTVAQIRLPVPEDG